MKENYKIPFLQERIKSLKGGKDYSHSKFINLLQNSQINYALGSVVGGWIGDTIGAYCQFAKTQISQSKLDEAMQMIGGGLFNILPGQFTDDSQLSAALLEGLTHYDRQIQFQYQSNKILHKIAKQYITWLGSAPFDIGNTCLNAIVHLKKNIPQEDKYSSGINFQKIAEGTYAMNGKMQSNGSLMRISPLCLFHSLYQKDNSQLDKFIKSQIKLTHPNQKLVELGLDWVHLNSSIIKRGTNKLSLNNIYEGFMNFQTTKSSTHIKQYIQECQTNELMNGIKQMGWAKIAFSYSIKQLRDLTDKEDMISSQGNSVFKSAIRKILKKGGDTDTNCAIVGSLVGGIVGFKGLPNEYIQTMMNLDFPLATGFDQISSNHRPVTYQPRYSMLNLLKLIGKIHPKYKILS